MEMDTELEDSILMEEDTELEEQPVCVLAASSPSGPLASLLDDEYYLLKIFQYLLDYGLQECRLVCKKWRAVCLRLPIVLGVVDPRNLLEASASFPEAVFLSTCADVRFGLVERGRPVQLGYAFSDLILFEKLQSLTLHLDSLPADACYHSFLQSVQQLISLQIVTDNAVLPGAFYQNLSCLTNLTLLQLDVWPDEHNKIHPITNLTRIRDLELCYDLFMNAEDELMFPSLVSLTRLAFVDDVLPNGHDYSRFLEVVSNYGPTLMSLGITFPRREMIIEEDWTLVEKMKRLKVLRIQDLVAVDDGFFAALRKINALTKLDIRWFRLNEVSLSDTIFSLTTLRSLKLQEIEEDTCDEAPWRDLSRLIQLTQLILSGGHLGQSVTHLTELLHLEMDIFCSRSIDLNETLSSLKKLQTVVIRGLNAVSISHDTLSRLKQLKALSLEMVRVDERFFEGLLSLPGLTKLYFQSDLYDTVSYEFLSQVNGLRNLESLTLKCAVSCSVSQCLFPSCLSKLKSLEVQDATDQERHKLRKLFPYLRKLKTDVFVP